MNSHFILLVLSQDYEAKQDKASKQLKEI